MKRRAAVEPRIGHLKSEHRLEGNRLKSDAGNAINAILAAAAMNFHKTGAPSFVFFAKGGMGAVRSRYNCLGLNVGKL